MAGGAPEGEWVINRWAQGYALRRPDLAAERPAMSAPPKGGPPARATIACEGCGRRPAQVCASDEPEHESALLFGDPLLGRLLCRACLRRSERDGPWSHVDPLEREA